MKELEKEILEMTAQLEAMKQQYHQVLGVFAEKQKMLERLKHRNSVEKGDDLDDKSETTQQQ